MPDEVMQRVDLTNCDKEPIHIPGAIQAHGCLIACDNALTTALRASTNCAEFLGLPKDIQTGDKLEQFLSMQVLHDLRNCASAAGLSSKPALTFNVEIGAELFDISVHFHKGNAILEFERPDRDQTRTPLDFARILISGISGCATVDTFMSRTPRLLRSALGYDRVMIYRFEQNGAGKVLSEAKRSDLEGFLGQYFPGSDIPQQARRLYLENTIRVISNASGDPVPVLPVLNDSREPLDMSFAHLRSVSPIHCEYLRNMGVAASMSISIVVGGKLWGLIACHHYEPRALSMAQRASAEMLGGFFSLQLEALTSKSALESAARTRTALSSIMRDVTYHGDITESLREKLPDFANFMQCDGVGLWINGAWSAAGINPPTSDISSLMRFLNSVAQCGVWASNELSAHFPAAVDYCAEAAGVLAIPLSQIPRDYLVFFRREVVETLNWAGDPNKTYTTGPLGDRLTPRKSFAIWKEMVERQSAPWTEEDREMAEAVRTALLEVIMRHSEILSAERQTADLRQKLLNEELNHRVKNILSLIKSLVSQPLESGRPLEDYVATLKGRIMALSHAHDQVIRNDGGGSLRSLLKAELTPYESRAINLDGPPVDVDSRAYSVLALVLHELATNAAKYGALSAEPGRLDVTWSLAEDGALEIAWTESGGPAVSPPKRSGFGSVLLNRSIPFDLGGASKISFDLDGLKARLRIPSRFVLANARTDAPHAARPQGRDDAAMKILDQRKVLLLEDQLVIAIDAEAMLFGLGAATIDTAATAPEAFRILSRLTPDVCVLDINLGAGTSIVVAEELVKRKIPFVFATGYGDSAIIPPHLRGVPVVRKPYDSGALTSALKNALGL